MCPVSKKFIRINVGDFTIHFFPQYSTLFPIKNCYLKHNKDQWRARSHQVARLVYQPICMQSPITILPNSLLYGIER